MQLLEELHSGELALPDFQRSFVWAPDATRELLVSMIRSFPAGTCCFLQGGSATFKARPSRRRPSRSSTVAPGARRQQRLTSLYQAVFGVGPSRFFLDVGAWSPARRSNEPFAYSRLTRGPPRNARGSGRRADDAALGGSRMGRWTAGETTSSSCEATRTRPRAQPAVRRRADVRRSARPLRVPGHRAAAIDRAGGGLHDFETLNRTGKPLTPFELISARAFAGGHSLRDFWRRARAPPDPRGLRDRARTTCSRSIACGSARHASAARSCVSPPDDIAARMGRGRRRHGRGDRDAARRMRRPGQQVAAVSPDADSAGGCMAQVKPPPGPSRAHDARELMTLVLVCLLHRRVRELVGDARRAGQPRAPRLAGRRRRPAGGPDFAWDPERWRTVDSAPAGLYRATIALTLTEQPRDFHTAAPLSQELIEEDKIDDHHVFPRGFLKDIGRGAETTPSSTTA